LPAVSRSFALVPACLLALLLAACGDSDKPKATASATPPTEAEVTESDLDANRCTPTTWDGAKDEKFKAPGAKLE